MVNPVAKRISARFRFIGEIISELKKVVWLTRREAAYLTFLVLVVAAAAGILLGTLDFGLTSLVDNFFIGK